MKSKDLLTKAYLFILFLVLPLDWFAPTGKLLREFGAKPAAPLLVCGAMFILSFRFTRYLNLSKPIYNAAFYFTLILFLGVIAFWLNLLFSWSGFGRAKNPITQFVAQAALFVAFAFAVIIHARLFTNIKWRSFALSTLPAVATIHLTIFLFEAMGLISHTHGWLSLFRNGEGINLIRPSGLMSEPSYFGAFAALYGFPLLVLRMTSKKAWCWILAGILFVAAILIRAKTLIPVVGAEYVALLWHQGRSAFRLKYAVLAILLLLASFYMVVANAALDMQENLSSAMRLGSTELALNVAGSGYALTGIGFGQFHFFYLPKYAPHFIFASQEARDQMAGSIDSRASTYDLYARLLVETGFLGLAVFLLLIYKSVHNVSGDYRTSSIFGVLLTAGSLGFLLTQDAYFYPPLAVGLSLLLGCASDRMHPSTRNPFASIELQP